MSTDRSFGQPARQSDKPLFGLAPSTGQTPASFFGTPANNNTNNGSNSASGAGTQGSTLFSMGTKSGTFGVNPTASPVGNAGESSANSTTPPSEFSLNRPEEKKQEENTTNAFGGSFLTPSNASPSSATFDTTSVNRFASPATFFSSGTPQKAALTWPLNATTTPAGPPPNSLFGNRVQQTSLFGQNNSPAPDVATPNPTSGLFGNLSSQAPASTPTTTQDAPSNLFRNAPSQANQPSALASLGGGLFGKAGQEAPKTPSLSFQPTDKVNQAVESPLGSDSSKNNVQATSKPPFSFPSSAASSAKSDLPATAEKPSLFGGNSASTSTSNLFSGLNQQKSPTEPAASSASNNLFATLSKAPASSTSSTNNLFGAIGLDKDKEATAAKNLEASSSAATTSAPTTTTAASTGGLFGASSAATQSCTTPATAATEPTANLGASTAGPAPTPQSRLKNKSMDEIITRWASDLSKYQKEFQAQAEKVAAWDRTLLENGNAISKLYSKTYQAERDTVEVQKQLSLVESDQNELSDWLDKYEKEVGEMMSRQVGSAGEGLQGPDQERERTYKMAEKVTDRLEDIGKDLTSMIEEINDATAKLSKTSKPDDPLSQIVRILNTHLSQLQLIDQGAADLQAKVNAATRESQRLGSRGNTFSNNENVDHFYRSFMRKG